MDKLGGRNRGTWLKSPDFKMVTPKGLSRKGMFMFKRTGWVTLGLFLIIGLLLPSVGAGYEYIDITNPFLRKLPLAVQPFRLTQKDKVTTDTATRMAGLLEKTLNFTDYFKLIEGDQFGGDGSPPPILGANIPFDKWTGVGAELLITGGLVVHDNALDVELRLFDTIKKKLVVGKRYTARVVDYRRIVRRFCSEVVQALTGNQGYFDSQIAFVSNGTGHKELYVCDFDGYQPHPITHNRSITLFPAWSSDGQWIAYTSFASGNPDLYIKNLKDKQGTIVDRSGVNISPAWVPGRFELAATLSFTGDQEIYLLTGAGKVIKRLTNNPGIDVSPTWSPDGKQMAFVSKRAGTPQIFIKNVETDAVHRLTFEGDYNTQPAWSPKGDKIAYSAMTNGQLNIFVIGADGQGVMQLTHDAGDNESPSWSPDGSMIVFSSTREGPSRIYVMTAFGTDQRRLLEMRGEQSDPAWSPNQTNANASSGS